MTRVLKTQFEITNYIIQADSKALSLELKDKAILVALSTYFNDKETAGVFKCFASHATLAKCVGGSVSTVKRGVAKLEQLNYISSKQQMDLSKVYTWLGFTAEKTKEVERFIEADKKRVAKNHKFKQERSAVWFKNNAYIKKCQEIVTNSNSESNSVAILKLCKSAQKAGILWLDYQPYNDFLSNANKPQAEVVNIPENTYHEPEPAYMEDSTPEIPDWFNELGGEAPPLG